MRAINKYILLKRSNEEAKTNGGLLMSKAEESEMRYQVGVVMVPGTLVEHIKEGDRIFFDKVHAFDVKIDGEMLTIVQERDVVAVL
jgi:co-chaperonin GroES (HSP10)